MSRRGAGRLAPIAAALLLFAQTVAVAHYHPRFDSEHPSLATVVNAETGQCALCLFACHFPVSASAAPAMMQPQPAYNVALAPSPGRAHATGRSPAQTRAPPLVVL
jgi:hypothetical protein